MIEKNKKGYFYDSQGNLNYRGKYEYSLLEGIASSGATSDIVFIFREATPEEMDNGFYGEVANWCYDGFNNLDFMENQIKEYEEKEGK